MGSGITQPNEHFAGRGDKCGADFTTDVPFEFGQKSKFAKCHYLRIKKWPDGSQL